MRWVPRCLVVAAVILLAATGARWQTSGRGESARSHATVFAPDIDVGDHPVGRATEVVFRITNTGDRPARVVGFEGARCGAVCCLSPKCLLEGHEHPLTIPAGGTLDVPCELRVNRPGPIEWSTTVFVEDGGIRPVRLTVRGVAVAVEGGCDGPHGP